MRSVLELALPPGFWRDGIVRSRGFDWSNGASTTAARVAVTGGGVERGQSPSLSCSLLLGFIRVLRPSFTDVCTDFFFISADYKMLPYLALC